MHAKAKAIINMVAATMKKKMFLEDQVVFQLVTMLERLITTLHEYLFLRKHEELERLQGWMGTLHTLRDAAIVDTINIAISPLALHPQVESMAPSKCIAINQKTTK